MRSSEGEILGFNATVPHKEAVMAAMDEVSEEAQMAGAGNTVVNDKVVLLGTTRTDRFCPSIAGGGGIFL